MQHVTITRYLYFCTRYNYLFHQVFLPMPLPRYFYLCQQVLLPMPVGTSNYASIFFYLCQYILLPMPVGTSTNASRHILLPMPLITSTNTSINNMETTDPKLILFQFRDDCKSYLLLHLHQQSPAPLCSTYRNRIAALKVASLCILNWLQFH